MSNFPRISRVGRISRMSVTRSPLHASACEQVHGTGEKVASMQHNGSLWFQKMLRMILKQAHLRDYRDEEILSHFLNVVFLDASRASYLKFLIRKEGEPDATMLLLLVELDAFLPIWCRNHTASNFLKTVFILHSRQWIDWRAIQWP